MSEEESPQGEGPANAAGRAKMSPRSVPRPGAEPITMAKSIADLDWRRAIVVATVAAIFAFIGTFTVGSIGDAEGYQLLQAIKPTTRTLCFTAIGASATILALMMTGLSLGKGWNRNFRPEHYNRIRQIALLSTLTIIISIFLLLFLNIPIQEADAFDSWYSAIYYSVTVCSSIIGGMLISTTILLYNAIAILIMAIDPHVDDSEVLD